MQKSPFGRRQFEGCAEHGKVIVEVVVVVLRSPGTGVLKGI